MSSANLKFAGIVLILSAIGAPAFFVLRSSSPAQIAPTIAETKDTRLTDPKAILAELQAGNARFVAGIRDQSTNTSRDISRRKLTAEGQIPIAAILCCADSRVVPEFIFDQHLSSLFVVRNAGNVVDGDVLGSLEYGVEHLHIPVVLVLGHTRCGAVGAVTKARGKPLDHHLKDIQANMAGLLPFILKHEDSSQETLNELAGINVRLQADRLSRESTVIHEEIEKNHAIIVTALYDVASGEVTFLTAK